MEDQIQTGARFAAFARLLLRRRGVFLILLLLLLGGLTSSLSTLRFDNSPDIFFRQHDPNLLQYQRFKELFETDEFLFLGFDAPEVWTPEFLADVRGLVSKIEAMNHIVDVTAITNVRHIEGGEGGIEVEDFLPPDLSSPEVIAERRQTALEHPYYKDIFVTADGEHLGILARTEIIDGTLDYKVELTRKVRDLIAQEPYRGWHTRVVGAPVLDTDSQEIVSQEGAKYGGIAFLLVALGFFWIFRSWLGVALPMLIAVLAIMATFGILTLFGAPLTVLTPIVPSFMISVGVGAAIYLMNEIYLALHSGLEVREAIVQGVRTSGLASFMSVATTAGGLLAFGTSEVKPVQDVGLAMGLGLLFAYLLAIILVPIGFSLLKKVRQSDRRDKMLHDRVEWLTGLASFVIRRRKVVIVLFAALAVVSILGALRLKADYYYLGMFSERMPVRQDYMAIDAVFKGSYSVEVLVKAQEEEGVKSPEILRKIADLQAYVEREHPELGTKTYSIVDVIREINQALNQGDSAAYRLPETREEIAQALLLFELSGDDELEDLVTADYQEARVRIGVRNLPFSQYEQLFQDVNGYVAQSFASGPSEPEVTLTGLVPLWAAIHRYVGESQVRALFITAFIVLVVLMMMFRSIPLGIVMSIFNLFAVVCTLGLMGWVGITLDPYTILVAAIALGLLDDDSIHMLKHVQWELRQGHTLETAIRETFASVGQAMFYISAVLIGTFAVYCTSAITSLAKFGYLTAFTIIVGALVELILTPAVLVTLRPLLFPQARSESAPTPAPEPAMASEP